MITSFKTKALFVALGLLALAQPAFAQRVGRGGVPLLGYYRPCIIQSKVEKAEIIKPQFEAKTMVYAQIEYPQFDIGVIERPQLELPKFLVPQMIRPEFLDACLPVYSAAYSAALARTSVALGVKFDAEGRIVKRVTADLNAVAMMPPNVAAGLIARTEPAARKPLVPAAPDAACCGAAPTAPPPFTGLRVRTREQ